MNRCHAPGISVLPTSCGSVDSEIQQANLLFIPKHRIQRVTPLSHHIQIKFLKADYQVPRFELGNSTRQNPNHHIILDSEIYPIHIDPAPGADAYNYSASE